MRHTSKPDLAVVIGGGFYGIRIALLLARHGQRVVLLERGPALIGRASFANQARVHNGYHYPRSILTALRSRVHYRTFLEEYAEAVDSSFEKYYAVARHGSKVSPAQFEQFCRHIQAPVTPAPRHVTDLFDRRAIAAVYRVTESAFDANCLRRLLTRQLDEHGVDVHCEAEVVHIGTAHDDVLDVTYRSPGAEHSLEAGMVVNCTYSGLNQVLRCAGSTPLPLKHELTELALVEMPPGLSGFGVTVMDGPFFSVMPFPAAGLHTLSHVRYTPHASWCEGPDARCEDGDELLARARGSSNAERMLRDAARFLPALADARYRDSLWEVKTVLTRSERDDSRPILLAPSSAHPGLISVMGAKIDSVYDVEALLRERIAAEALIA